jgi:hypothetical protein
LPPSPAGSDEPLDGWVGWLGVFDGSEVVGVSEGRLLGWDGWLWDGVCDGV